LTIGRRRHRTRLGRRNSSRGHTPERRFVKDLLGFVTLIRDRRRPPSAYYRVALIKVRGGCIAHVETLERPVFYGMSLGWSG